MKQLFILCSFSLFSFSLYCQLQGNGDCLAPLPIVIYETPSHCNPQEPIIVQLLFPDLYEEISWMDLQQNVTVTPISVALDSIQVASGMYQVQVIDYNGCHSSEIIKVGLIDFLDIQFSNVVYCNAEAVCWAAPSPSQSGEYFFILKDSGLNGWEGAELEVIIDQVSNFYTLDSSELYAIHDISVPNESDVQFIFHTGNDDEEITIEIINDTGYLVYSSGTEGIISGELFAETADFQHEALLGTWSCSCSQLELEQAGQVDFLAHENCLLVDPNCIGECTVVFSATDCDFEYEQNIELSTAINLQVPDYSICPEEEVIIEAYAEPEICFLNSNEDLTIPCSWSPNCVVSNAGIYSLNISTVCADSEAQSLVTVVNTSAGEVFLNGNLNSLTIFLSEESSLVNFSSDSSSEDLYQYIITDSTNSIISMAESNYDFSNFETGQYRIWGICYTGELNVTLGDNINTASSTECYDLSNSYASVTVEIFDYISENDKGQMLNWIMKGDYLSISNLNSKGDIALYNSSGQLVLQTPLLPNGQISTSTLSSGAYFCVFTGEGIHSKFKLCKVN